METATVISRPEQINYFRLRTMLMAMKLELKGLKNSRGSVYALVKREFGLKGSKQNVYEQFEKIVNENRPF